MVLKASLIINYISRKPMLCLFGPTSEALPIVSLAMGKHLKIIYAAVIKFCGRRRSKYFRVLHTI
jgi:hypothetical protein